MFTFGSELLFAVQTLVLTLLSFNSLVSAQQYEGDTITNSLPSVDNSEIAYFKIHNSAGQTGTVTNYYGLNSTGGRIVPSEVKRAVIFLHGYVAPFPHANASQNSRKIRHLPYLRWSLKSCILSGAYRHLG